MEGGFQHPDKSWDTASVQQLMAQASETQAHKDFGGRLQTSDSQEKHQRGVFYSAPIESKPCR